MQKHQFILRTDKELFDKVSQIAQENERSINQEIIFLMKNHVKKYEQEHWEIPLQTDK